MTYASRRTSEGLQRASNYLDGTATRAEGARQLLKTLKKKDALSQTRRKRFWPSPRPTPSYNATTRHRKRDVLRQSTQSLVFRCLGVAAELWRRFNLLRERSLLGMLVLAFALGRATLSPTKRDPFHKKAPLVGAAIPTTEVALRRVFVAGRAAGPFIESNAN